MKETAAEKVATPLHYCIGLLRLTNHLMRPFVPGARCLIPWLSLPRSSGRDFGHLIFTLSRGDERLSEISG